MAKNIRDYFKTRIAGNQSGGVGVVIFLAFAVFAVMAVPAVIGANRVSDKILDNFNVETEDALDAFDTANDVGLTTEEAKDPEHSP